MPRSATARGKIAAWIADARGQSQPFFRDRWSRPRAADRCGRSNARRPSSSPVGGGRDRAATISGGDFCGERRIAVAAAWARRACRGRSAAARRRRRASAIAGVIVVFDDLSALSQIFRVALTSTRSPASEQRVRQPAAADRVRGAAAPPNESIQSLDDRSNDFRS